MEPIITDKTKIDFIKKDEALARDQIRTLNVLRGRSKCDNIDATPKFVENLTSAMSKCKDLASMDVGVAISAVDLYIAERAQLVIHVASSVVPKLLDDTHYRSSFETNSHAGSGFGRNNGYMTARYKWESDCFLGLYDNLKSDFERPKYGAINFLNKLSGAAAGYGTNYMVLKPHVRRRITVSTGDTSSSRCIGVLDYCHHVLNALTDNELVWLVKVAAGLVERTPENERGVGSTYREIQIHGELDIARDVERMYIGDLSGELSAEFTRKFGIPTIAIGKK